MLEAIRDCLDGEIPGLIATCAMDGVPNASFVSQVHYIDPQHVAMSFQFFNKTHQNVRANPRAAVMVSHPQSAARYALQLQYLRTETEGPLFESMKAKLMGIASHTGMSGVFALRGADIYRVLSVQAVAGTALPTPPKKSLLPAVRSYAQGVSRWSELSALLDGTLVELEALFGIRHAMVHWLDETGQRLFAVASHGYAQSGIGSEIHLGQGLIGTAASARVPIRITHVVSEYTYSRAARQSVRDSNLSDRLEAEIPLPGLAQPGSQLAVPIMSGKRLLGVLCVESMEESSFGYDEEDALVAIASHLGLAAHLLAQTVERNDETPSRAPVEVACEGRPVVIRHYPADDTVFIDDLYLIKGVAGAILWRLLGDFCESGRREFSNRELKLDPRIPLPDLSSNLEARLILLQRRLIERCDFMALEKTGRGRFRLRVTRPVRLVDCSS